MYCMYVSIYLHTYSMYVRMYNASFILFGDQVLQVRSGRLSVEEVSDPSVGVQVLQLLAQVGAHRPFQLGVRQLGHDLLHCLEVHVLR